MAGKPRQTNEALILSLAEGMPLARAARHAGVSERTAHRRMREPDFREQVSKARGEMLGQAFGVVSHAATDAATTLRKLLKSDSDAVRLGAARALLENLSRMSNDYEFEQRLARIEQAALRVANVSEIKEEDRVAS